MKKNTVITILCMVLVAVISVMGTLAYLTAEKSVVNTFTVGNIDILLDEASVDKDGNLILDDADNPVERVIENDYHLIPGKTYVKDPTVTVVKDSERAYVRMILEINNASTLDEIIKKCDLDDYADFLGGWDESVWKYHNYVLDTENNVISFEFRYKDVVATSSENVELPPLFETIIVPGEATNEDLKALYDGGFKMTVYGHAIQADNIQNEEEAWKLFDEEIK